MILRSTSIIFLFFSTVSTEGYSTEKPKVGENVWNTQNSKKLLCNNRRSFLSNGVVASTAILTASINRDVAFAVDKQSVVTAEDLVRMIQDASETLDKLLDNWDKATIDCTYADVPRDLLETKNKEMLLDKASTFALFDKSVSVVSCKKSNKIVRDYIGATGKGPLVGIEKRVTNKKLIDLLDPDNLDEYIGQTELFSQSLAKATSLSYAAGVADFDSVNNFQQGEENTKISNLDETKVAIREANSALRRILALLSS